MPDPDRLEADDESDGTKVEKSSETQATEADTESTANDPK
jgi:hypothetical protein